jgi:cold shock CspA family protein
MVQAARKTGILKTWLTSRGFGFISCEGEKDYFVGINDFMYVDWEQGDAVSFDATVTQKGNRAKNVKRA